MDDHAALSFPPVTICLTILNEESGLPAFLNTVSAQRSLPTEIIVVDGGSTDGSVDILRDWAHPAGVTLTIIELPGANISEGRNRAIAAASTEWIAVTDAGTDLDQDWLLHLRSRMRPEVDVVSGFFEPLDGRPMRSLIGATITPLLSEVDGESFLPSSRSVAFRKLAWESAGRYPTWLDYCEDLVFDLALKTNGAQFTFVGSAVARWDARGTLSAYAKQYYRYARGDGKAGLWPRRHALRYATYFVGGATVVATVVSGKPIALAAVPFGVAYLFRYWRRIMRHDSLTPRLRLAGIIAAPAIVVLGDLAKMVGYPVGVRWRRRERAPQ